MGTKKKARRQLVQLPLFPNLVYQVSKPAKDPEIKIRQDPEINAATGPEINLPVPENNHRPDEISDPALYVQLSMDFE